MKVQLSAMGLMNRNPAFFCKIIPFNIGDEQGTTWPVLLGHVEIAGLFTANKTGLCCLFAYTSLY